MKAEPHPHMTQQVHLFSAYNTCVCTCARARAHARICATRVVERVHVLGAAKRCKCRVDACKRGATEGGIPPGGCYKITLMIATRMLVILEGVL